MLDWLLGKRRNKTEEPAWKTRARKQQSCFVYERDANVFVFSLGPVELGGPSRYARPIHRIVRSESARELGDAIIDSLVASQQPLSDRELQPKEKLKFIGVKSQAQLYREAKTVDISAQDDEEF